MSGKMMSEEEIKDTFEKLSLLSKKDRSKFTTVPHDAEEDEASFRCIVTDNTKCEGTDAELARYTE